MLIERPPAGRAPTSLAHHNGYAVHRPHNAEPWLVRQDFVHEAIGAVPGHPGRVSGRRRLARADEDETAGADVRAPGTEIAGHALKALIGVKVDKVNRLVPRCDSL